MKNVILLLLICFLWSCDKNDDDYLFKGDGTQINIYLVKDGQVDYSQTDIDLETLELEETPWLKHSEIEFYDWSSHMFFLNIEKEKGKYSGRHFVIKADNKPLLLGIFFPSYASSMPQFPSIIAHDDLFYPMDLIGLGGYGFYNNSSELAKDGDFHVWLEKSGLLREGIKVELANLKRKSATTLEYTFQVTNTDTQDIYILDPNKMGTDRFHYYTNGVSCYANDKMYYASNFESLASDKIQDDWYHKLAPGRMMARTILLNGYESLPTGKVKASFNFPGSNHLSKGEWEKSNGRIWVGGFWTEKELTLH